MSFINIKSPSLQKILRIWKESQRLRKNIAIHIFDTRLVPRIHKEILQFNIKRWHKDFPGSSVVKTCTSTAGGTGLIPGQGTKILQAATNGSACLN